MPKHRQFQVLAGRTGWYGCPETEKVKNEVVDHLVRERVLFLQQGSYEDVGGPTTLCRHRSLLRCDVCEIHERRGRMENWDRGLTEDAGDNVSFS